MWEELHHGVTESTEKKIHEEGVFSHGLTQMKHGVNHPLFVVSRDAN